MTKFISSTGLTYLWSKIKAWVQSAFVSNVSISGNKVRITKNGSNTDLTVPYATNSGTATKIGSSTVGSSSKPIYLSSGTPTQVSTIDGSILGGYIGYNNKGFLITHPEATNGIVVPYLYNDIAFLKSQGGSVSIYSTTATNLTAETLTVKTDWNSLSGIYNMFNASPEYFNAGNGNAAEMNTDGLIIDITLPRVFSYINVFYIDFGNASWGFDKVDIFVRNFNYETSYVNKISGGSVNDKSEYYVKIAHYSTNSSGTTVAGFNQIRLHLYGRTAGGGVRIAQIGLINFSSLGHRYTTMSRGIDDAIWRSITPYNSNLYSLGSSTNRWANIHSVLGDFSGLITASEGIAVPNGKNITIGGKEVLTAHQDISGKQDTLTFDTTPTENSTNPVTSGGVYTALAGKQGALVSGTNIKTINNESLLGSGNISIQGGGGDTNVIEIVKVNGTALTPDSNKAVDVPVPTKVSDLTNDSGFITGYTETDPVFTASAAHGISSSDISSWNAKGTYSKPSGGIPASDIASGVIPTVPSNVSTFTNDAHYVASTAITTIVSLTQAAYDALATKDANTLYIIPES